MTVTKTVAWARPARTRPPTLRVYLGDRRPCIGSSASMHRSAGTRYRQTCARERGSSTGAVARAPLQRETSAGALRPARSYSAARRLWIRQRKNGGKHARLRVRVQVVALHTRLDLQWIIIIYICNVIYIYNTTSYIYIHIMSLGSC